jgi:uncharacterized SAM-binding protein YcdF (DUF218 family)
MIFLNKILPVFVMPIMLIIYLLIYGVWKKKHCPIYTAIVLTGNVENTADESKEVMKLMGKWKHVILVTSAYHMPRSVQLFENQELIVKPYQVDYKLDQLSSVTFMDFLPDADSFRLLNTGYRELIGRVIYYIF